MEKSAHKIFISGVSRGLGNELVKLLSKNSQAELHISSRQTPQQALKTWSPIIPNPNYYQLDINSPQSINETINTLKNNNIKFNTIIANAAVGLDQQTKTVTSVEKATLTLQTNVLSTINFVRKFLEVLEDGGRVIIVSSILGRLNIQKQETIKLLTNPSITQADIQNHIKEFINACKNQDSSFFGHLSSYAISKALINSWGRYILPKSLKANQEVLVIHPGWCKTQMSGYTGPLEPYEGALLMDQCIWLKQVEVDKFWNKGFCGYDDCGV